MSENNSDRSVEPPENDEMFETTDDPDAERDQMVEQAVQQARQFHQVMDQAKEWSRETVADVRVEAALADGEETTEELERIAGLVQSVNARIERGDNSLARRP